MQLISDRDSDAEQTITGAQIAANADLRSRSYTLRSGSSTGGIRERT